ncbi:helicase [Clostridiales Family XIII bacterium ASD5510]|uniref:Helicase n=1 Tax=Hominibacterium faecale TaxID=2839743 RepID=A0A9J6QW65_9FIRM|nr:helicase [Hominibacterium faecale]MCU7378926.1 helicase [Hominibacterium faecale]
MIYRYITENTFDAYSWQLIENKQKFISQIMTSKSAVRSCEDVDEAALSYAEVKALATGNPFVKEKMDLDVQVSRLKLLKANYQNQIYTLEDNVYRHYPAKIKNLLKRAEGLKADAQTYQENQGVAFCMELEGKPYTEKKDAGTLLLRLCKKEARNIEESLPIGRYCGFVMQLEPISYFSQTYVVSLEGTLRHKIELGEDVFGNLTRLHNYLEKLPEKLAQTQREITATEEEIQSAQKELEKPFLQEEELKSKQMRLSELEKLLEIETKQESGQCEEMKQEEQPEFEKGNTEPIWSADVQPTRIFDYECTK